MGFLEAQCSAAAKVAKTARMSVEGCMVMVLRSGDGVEVERKGDVLVLSTDVCVRWNGAEKFLCDTRLEVCDAYSVLLV